MKRRDPNANLVSCEPGIDPPVLWHTCEDGHKWHHQIDGGVAPSWGGGRLSVYRGRNPLECPEPERDEQGRFTCPTCGTKHYTSGCIAASNFSFMISGEPDHDLPEPVCGKPPVETRVWSTADKLRWEVLPLDEALALLARPGEQMELAV